jgi:hypothetical protein
LSNETAIGGPFAGTVINVKHHRVEGDGKTDDTERLRAVIAASKRGDAIYFPRGTYLVSGHLGPKPEQVYFSLTDGTILKAVPESEPFSVFDVKAGPVEFHHLTLDLSKPEEIESPKNEPPPAILAQAAARGTVDLVVSCCRIRHARGQGIRVGGSGDSRRRDRVVVRTRGGLLRERPHAQQGQRRPGGDVPIRALPERDSGGFLSRRGHPRRRRDRQQAGRDRAPVLARLACEQLRRHEQRRRRNGSREAPWLGHRSRRRP